MVELNEAARRFGLTKRQLYMRLVYRNQIGKQSSEHNGSSKAVYVDMEKVNIVFPNERLRLEELYFEVSEKLGDKFASTVAKKAGVRSQTVRNYFNRFSFVFRDKVLKYIKILEELNDRHRDSLSTDKGAD